MSATLKLEPVRPGEDGNTGHRWMACVDFDGTPAYDGSGETIEDALAALALQMADALEKKP